ncbi:MAG TPA: MarR family transcriptional regulator [Stellaceae bacterium]|nr:MarR family transcriptional regulator [Stellaceae bacterium]
MTPPAKTARVESEAMLRHWLAAVPNDRLAHLVKDAARGLVRSLQLRLTEHGVSFGHWVFLRVLWEEDGLTQRELSVRAGMMEPTTLAAVRALETLGYVRRRQRKDNRKNVYVTLTPAGAALKSRLVPLAEEVNAIAVRGIAADALAVTRATLLAMIGNLVGDEAMLAQEERRLPSTRALARLIEAQRRRRATRARPAAAARAVTARKRAR